MWFFRGSFRIADYYPSLMIPKCAIQVTRRKAEPPAGLSFPREGAGRGQRAPFMSTQGRQASCKSEKHEGALTRHKA